LKNRGGDLTFSDDAMSSKNMWKRVRMLEFSATAGNVTTGIFEFEVSDIKDIADMTDSYYCKANTEI
jgi:hypothetical protein